MNKQKHKFICVWILLAVFCVLAGVVLYAWRHSANRIPDNVGVELSHREQIKIIERNSPLAQYVLLSPNATFPREDTIKKITIHHMAGDIKLEQLGKSFANPDRRASSNYAIDVNGNIAIYVEERDRAWTSASPENDNQAVTIEVANDENGGNWHVSDASYAALIDLCTDICKRNGISELVYTGDKTGSLTIHKFFYNKTECPGPYLESHMPDIAEAVTQNLINSDNP